jgi:tetratricopeptide (TPR) repeat protein
MKVRAGAFLFLLLTAVLPVSGAESPDPEEVPKKSIISLLDLTVTPGIEYPIESGLDLLNLGAHMDIRGSLPLPFLPWLSVAANLSYSWLPTLAESSISLLSVGIGARATWEINRRLTMYGFLAAGGYYGFFNSPAVDPYGTAYPDQQGGNPFISGGTGVTFYLAPPISIGVDVSAIEYFGLTLGLRATLGASVHLDGFSRKVALADVRIDDLFSPLFKRYADHPVGTAVLINEERFSIENVDVSVFVKDFMDSPTTCAAPDSLAPGEALTVDLTALLSDAVLELKEATKITAELKVEYTLNGKRQSSVSYQTVRLYGRNSITWDDDRKAAVFVTLADPEVLSFSKLVAGMVKNKGPKTVNQNLRMAMGIFDGLSLYGIRYVIDPNTPSYQDAAKNKQTIDFLQFPRQTLAYKGGDCDDLSILLCAMLESIGIETAFITVPGHIYMAASLDMTPAEARGMFSDVGDLLFVGKSTWLPIEATMIGSGFMAAWQTAAREWREASAKNQTNLYPVHECWQEYEVAGSPSDAVTVSLPSVAGMTDAYMKEISAFIDRELGPKVRELQALIAKNARPMKERNLLGVLYAQFGKDKEAEAEFLGVLKLGEYVPALANLGNIYLARGDYTKALAVLERAQRAAPDNSTVLINLARVNYELGNGAQVNRYVALANTQSPGLSDRFPYLKPAGEDTSARAADLERTRETYLWAIEQ